MTKRGTLGSIIAALCATGCGVAQPDAPAQVERIKTVANAAAYTVIATEMLSTEMLATEMLFDDGPCPVTKCGCRASDAQVDLLCPAKPATNASACGDIDGYSGADGQSCTGYGLRGANNQYASVGGTLEGCAIWSGPADGPTCAQRADQAFKCAVKTCDEKELTQAQYDELVSTQSSGLRCAKLGTMKHECVEDEIANEPELRAERSYDMSERPPKVVRDQSGAETVGHDAAKAAKEQQGLQGPLKRPDALFGSNAGPMTAYDAKFPCPDDVKSHAMFTKSYPSDEPTTGASMMSPLQRRSYRRIANQGQPGKGKVKAVSPHDVRNETCP